MPNFRSRPATLSPIGYENVCCCRHTTVARKRTYLRSIAACADGTAASAEHERQRRGELRRGPTPDKLEPDEGLGVLMSESVFVDKMARAFGMSTIRLKRELEAWLRFHQSGSTALLRPKLNGSPLIAF